MTSPSQHIAPTSSSAWFAVAVPATVVALILASIVWFASANSWLSLATFVVWGGAGLAAAWRTGHDHLAPYLGGAVVTMVGLFVVPLVMAHYYIGH